MRSGTIAIHLVVGLAAWGCGIAWSADPAKPLYDEALVPTYTLPDVLAMADGTPVATPDDWWSERRPEIVHLFEQNVYGEAPAAPAGLRWEMTGRDPPALAGLATRTTIRVLLEGTTEGAAFDLLVYRPNAVAGPAPVFLALNFQGNQAVHGGV